MFSFAHRRVLIALFAVLLGASGCASAGGGGAGGDGGGRRSSTRIAADELATVSELDLFSAVQRLRPQWLRPGTRGALPGLIVDGTPQSGGVEQLRSYQAADVGSLELMNASDATTRYGTGYTQGAIVVNTRRR